MFKKMVLFTLILSLIFTQNMTSPNAKNIYEVKYIHITYEDNSNKYEVIQKDGDLYFPAETFGKISRYKYKQGKNRLSYTLGKKVIMLDPASGKMEIPILGYNGSVGKIIKQESIYYVSASKILPWLNVECFVNEGILNIVPDKKSFWEISDDFNYDTYMFNLSETYGDSVSDNVGLAAMTVFDNIVNLRWDELVPADGTISGAFHNASLYDYHCYVSAFTDMATDDTLISKSMGTVLDTTVNANSKISSFEEIFNVDEKEIQKNIDDWFIDAGMGVDVASKVYDFTEKWIELRELINSYNKISKYADVLSLYKYFEISVKADSEYRDYISWLSTKNAENSLINLSIKKVNVILKKKKGVFIAYGLDFGDKLLGDITNNIVEQLKKRVDDKKGIRDLLSEKSFFNSLNSYMTISKAFYNTVIPVANGYEGMAKVGVNEDIQDYCWSLSQSLLNGKMTEDNLMHIRQSYLTALKASKRCYEAMQDTMDIKALGFITMIDGEGLLDSKLNLIDKKIVELECCTEVTEHDSIEGKNNSTKILIDSFKEIKLTDKDDRNNAELMNLYKDVFESGNYKYYAFVDMNDDKLPELLVSESKTTVGGASYPQNMILEDTVDVYAYRNGKVQFIEAIGYYFDNLSYNERDHKIRSLWGGSGYEQYIYYSLDEDYNIKVEYLSNSMDDNTYYFGDDVNEDYQISESEFDIYLEQWKDSEYIGFSPI